MKAQFKIDVDKKPEPLPPKEFVFPRYIETKLSNGMKVFIIEDNEQPTFAFRLLIPGGSAYDFDKPGLAELVAEMLTKGAGKLTAYQIAEKLDGVGASLRITANPDHFIISGSCITKHIPVLLEILSKVLIEPTFPNDEFEKLKPRIISAIKNEKARPMSIASNLSKKIIYGEHHPYGKKKTEESIGKIKLEDLKQFYKQYIVPNYASLVIVGAVKEKEIVSLFNKALEKWEKGKIPPLNLPPIKPAPLGVYYVKRPASVQSTIILSTPTVEITHPDYDAIDLASSVIGSGFAGRLFRTLRETYSYTYSPFGFQTSSKFANRFACGADVRNQVTDSAINVIKEQLLLLATEAPSEEELNRIKKVEIGSYFMSFENTEFVASLIQNAHFFGKPMSYLKEYHKIIEQLTPYDIQKVADKYLHPKKAYIFVVGNPEVQPMLEKFGKVYEYDLDLKPVTGEKAKMEKVDLKPNELIKKYLDKRGGTDLIQNVKTLYNEANAKIDMQGQVLEGKIIEKIKSPLRKYQLVDFNMFQSEIWFLEDKSWSKVQGVVEELKFKEHDKNLFDYAVLFDPTILEKNFKIDILGKQGNNILVKFTSINGFEATVYFDSEKFIINRIESVEESHLGSIPVTTDYLSWETVSNFLFPKIIKSSNPMYSIEIQNSYKLNEEFDDSIFIPKQ
ncbi:MAG: insulinase family protein [Ignavibacteria bacterium]|nr:insulinase family protein [Ignavibacteria bacterium]